MYSKLDRELNYKPESSKPLVLIVDDDRDNLLFASYIVESMALSYEVTDQGEQCFSLVKELMPDIILLDIVMPRIDGITIAQKLKQEESLAHIPIIAVTGLTNLKDKKKLVAAKFDDYLCKPYLIEELETKLKFFLQPPSI